MKEVYFYSKSKDIDDIGLGIKDWRKRLSNFWIYDPKGKFPSIEHAFQYMKYRYSSNPSEADRIPWNQLSAERAKQMGSKKEFAKRHLVLRIEKWNRDRIDIMIRLILNRCTKDKTYRQIIKKLSDANVKIIHFSRNDFFWGASTNRKGNNYLGKILQCIGNSFELEI